MVFISNIYKKETDTSRLKNPMKRYQSSEVQSQDCSFQIPASYCHNNVTGLGYFREQKSNI